MELELGKLYYKIHPSGKTLIVKIKDVDYEKNEVSTYILSERKNFVVGNTESIEYFLKYFYPSRNEAISAMIKKETAAAKKEILYYTKKVNDLKKKFKRG